MTLSIFLFALLGYSLLMRTITLMFADDKVERITAKVLLTVAIFALFVGI